MTNNGIAIWLEMIYLRAYPLSQSNLFMLHFKQGKIFKMTEDTAQNCNADSKLD